MSRLKLFLAKKVHVARHTGDVYPWNIIKEYWTFCRWPTSNVKGKFVKKVPKAAEVCKTCLSSLKARKKKINEMLKLLER